MSTWAALEAELTRWRAAGRQATLWWRDDDAAAPCAALGRLLDMAGARGIPLALAVVPATATAALAAALEPSPGVSVLVHGYAHRNHAPAGEKKCEFGAARPPHAVARELAKARTRTAELFGARMRPILVPPWNRLPERWLGAVAAAGYRGLSCYRARPRGEPVAGLRAVNCHVDIVDWRGARGFVGEAAALELLCGHLRRRREGAQDGDEPTGLLTHHLVHDEGCWAFIGDLAGRLGGHPGARWIDADEAFALGP